jgi:hypothetical protein
MNAREKQLPLRSDDPVPLPRSPSNIWLPATKTDPYLTLCLLDTSRESSSHWVVIHECLTFVNPC